MSNARIPTKPPTTRTIDFGAQVRGAWGDSWHKKEVVYKFSNGREFKDSGAQGGPYSPPDKGS